MSGDDRQPRPVLYYGWVLVGVLGVLATVSYGILSYAFSVFIQPMQSELGWTKAQITGAFSLATLVAGVAAVPVGRRIDAHGARGVMTAGGVLAAALLVAWSRTQSLAAYYAIWAGMGVAMAAVLYEPAFAVVAVWFRRDRGRALTALTFLGGFASVIFVPLASAWVEAYGWRGALLRLALVQAAITIPLPALLIRRRPEDMGLVADGGTVDPGPARRSAAAADVLRSPSFRWVAVCFGLSAFASTAVSVHLVPLLLERGFRPGFAAAAMGTLGLMALPGRLVFTPLGDRWSRGTVTAAIFALQLSGLMILLASTRPWAVWGFVALFGAGFGAITPARAALVADLYGSEAYGSIAGSLAFVLAITRAAAPVGTSLLHDSAGGYTGVVLVLLLLCAGSAAASLALARRGSEEPGADPRLLGKAQPAVQ